MMRSPAGDAGERPGRQDRHRLRLVVLAAAQAGIWPLLPWYLSLFLVEISAFGALRGPAYQAATSLLVPRR
jgi:hypothetical protein